jgi:DNA gyrase/topoisomerase IV subunit A
MVLLNGINGMATGWSTNILPHKYEDLRDAVIRVLQNKPVGKINPYFNAYPDIKIQEVDNGRDNASSYNFYGKVKKINSNTVQIYSVPPGMKMDDVQEHLDSLIEQRKIQDYTNNTTDVVDISVKIARKELAELSEDQLVTLFNLRVRDTERLVCVDFSGDKIRVFNNDDELITDWVVWRFQYIVKRFEVMIDETSEELQYQRALKALFDGQFVRTIPTFKSKDEMRKSIAALVQERFDLRPSRIDRILNLAAYSWTLEYREENTKKIAELEKELSRLKTIRSNDNNMKSEWISDLKKAKF